MKRQDSIGGLMEVMFTLQRISIDRCYIMEYNDLKVSLLKWQKDLQ